MDDSQLVTITLPVSELCWLEDVVEHDLYSREEPEDEGDREFQDGLRHILNVIKVALAKLATGIESDQEAEAMLSLLDRLEGDLPPGDPNDGSLQRKLVIGRNLLTIQKGRLYRARRFRTFEAYCQGRWGLMFDRASELIEAANK